MKSTVLSRNTCVLLCYAVHKIHKGLKNIVVVLLILECEYYVGRFVLVTIDFKFSDLNRPEISLSSENGISSEKDIYI